MSDTVDYDDWINVQSEEEILKKCYDELPSLNLTFEEFRIVINEAKARKSQSSTLFTKTLWLFNALWVASGYASTIFTMAKYRDPLLILIRWFLSS
jgi:hypothetical protein